MRKKAGIIKKGLFKLSAFLMASVMGIASAAMAASAAFDSKYNFPEDAASVNITLDGENVLVGEAAIINSVTYVPLRSFSELVGADSITWDQKTATATVKKGTTTLYVRNGGYYLEASGRYFYTPEKVLNIDI